MFRRAHHRRIAQVLEALDADKLAEHQCWFGGGTAIALTHGEYRESVDIDFLVSDLAGYRDLRGIVAADGLSGLAKSTLEVARPPRSDGYGIRTAVVVDGVQIKFEIIHEGRVSLGLPDVTHEICGVRTLTPVDQVASKLLANDDRWADGSVFGRDLIDLAMMRPDRATFHAGLTKAEGAYGTSVRESFAKATAFLRDRPGRLDDYRRALGMETEVVSLLHRIISVAEMSSDAPTQGKDTGTSTPRE